MYIRYFILIVACILCLPATAQNKSKYSNSEFRAKKQAYMAEKAGLTEEESEKFFPLYFEFQDKKKEINKNAAVTAAFFPFDVFFLPNSKISTKQFFFMIYYSHRR